MDAQQATLRAKEVMAEYTGILHAAMTAEAMGLTKTVEKLTETALDMEMELAAALRAGGEVPHPIDPAGVEGFLERHPEGMTGAQLMQRRMVEMGMV